MLMHEKPSVQDIKSITEEKIEEGNVSIEDTWLSCDQIIFKQWHSFVYKSQDCNSFWNVDFHVQFY